ncbi:unnamed protein product [Cladocopium goreaui]|uniref:Pumilio-like 5 n=1 Tax=Cladocopium goreaui TaxID=2562237 RepID=A0A9P1C4H8_9DINO|nr:unnamed protein product [Cladocopium goreaui]|mmetsp:Transcript_24064/g.52390  ORF Transcript_24064/g.52390 Transcript_24064/m.52390 type:complete len:338 (+) Transcript_24064:747-1760(+)
MHPTDADQESSSVGRQQAHPLQALSSRLRFATEAPSWVVYLPQELQDRICGASRLERGSHGSPGPCHSFGIAFETIMKEKGSCLRSQGSWWSQRVWTLSRDSKGCREVQRAFDEADQEERLALASELRGHVWEALRCPFANYVLQKCVTVLSRENLNFIFQELKQKGPEMIQQAARHKYGCRIIQRLLECGPQDQVRDLIDCLLEDAINICAHPYGNYVIQNLLDQSTREQRRRLLQSLMDNVTLVGNESDNVYVSAVMVKIMSVAQREEKVQLARSLLRVPGLLRKMGTTRHGHQAAKKVLKTLTGSEHEDARFQLYGHGGEATTESRRRAATLRP